MEIDEILERLAGDVTCEIAAPCGLPVVESPLGLPADVARFYERTGGMVLNKNGRRGNSNRVARVKRESWHTAIAAVLIKESWYRPRRADKLQRTINPCTPYPDRSHFFMAIVPIS